MPVPEAAAFTEAEGDGFFQMPGPDDIISFDSEDEDEPGETETPQPLEFDKRHRESLNGLLFLGYLEDDLAYVGHKFIVRTIYTDDFLKASILTKEFLGTMADSRAWATAMVSMCVKLVDGKPIPAEPLGPDEDGMAAARLRFAYVRENWFPWVVDAVYSKYLELEAQAQELIESMGKAQS